MRSNPKPQEIYQHFKGNQYQIITLAEHSETGEVMVIYQALYGTYKVYVRPLAMFMEKTDRSKYPDARQEYRFQLYSNSERQQEETPELDVTRTVPAQADTFETAQTDTFETAQTDTFETAQTDTFETAQTDTSKTVQTDAFGAVQTNISEAVQVNAQETAKLEIPETEKSAAAEPFIGKVTAAGTDTVSEDKIKKEIYETEQKEEENDWEMAGVDPMVMEFLGADTHEERLRILSGVHHRITDSMINTMAVSIDVEIEDGDLEERYEELRHCLQTMRRFEINR